MGLYELKPSFQRRLQPLAERLVMGRVRADVLSGLGVLAALAGAGLLLWGPPESLALLAPIALARLACNALDGMVARATGQASGRGYVVNELSDRAADVVLLGALGLGSGADPWLGGLALVFTLLSSHLAVAAHAAGGRRLVGGPMGKAERMAVLGLAGLAAAALHSRTPLGVALWIVVVGLAFTLAGRARQVGRELGALA